MKVVSSRYQSWLPSATTLLCLGLVFAFWLNANPYLGITQDARLYSVMAYRWLTPQSFARDPWFLFGSQDDYSLFSPLLATAFTFFGVSDGARWMTLAQGLLFSLAVLAFVRQGLGKHRYVLAALLMAAFPVMYLPGMLYVTEGFVTPRGFAIALSLIGLTMSVRRLRVWAAICHLLAMSLHPIMALAPMAVSLLYPFNWRYRIALLLLGLVGYVLLLFAALRGYLPLIDGDWRYYLEFAPLVFTTDWLLNELPWLVLWFSFLMVGAKYGAPRLRRMYGLFAIVPVIGMLFSWLGTLVPWTLAMQAQFWRGLWLLKLMGLCAIADILGIHVIRRSKSGVRAWRLLTAWVLWAGFTHPLWAAAPIALFSWRTIRAVVDRWLEDHVRIYRCFIALLIALSVPEWIFALSDRVTTVVISGFWREVLHGFWRTAALGLIAVGMAWCLPRVKLPMRTILVATLIGVAAQTWDSRSHEQKIQEDRYSIDGHSSCLGNRIPLGATVYWPEQILRTWLELGTASYVGGLHATGSVFSRDRLTLVEQRLSNIVVATTSKGPFPSITDTVGVRTTAMGVLATRPLVSWNSPFSYESSGRPTSVGIAWLCQDHQLDYVLNPPIRNSDACTELPKSLTNCNEYRKEQPK